MIARGFLLHTYNIQNMQFNVKIYWAALVKKRSRLCCFHFFEKKLLIFTLYTFKNACMVLLKVGVYLFTLHMEELRKAFRKTLSSYLHRVYLH